MGRFLLSDENLPLIIDEPFTSLDLISEEENLKVLKKYIKGSSGILVSHKMNVIKLLSDEIIIMEDGKISARGTHEFLINSNELYKNLQIINNKNK